VKLPIVILLSCCYLVLSSHVSAGAILETWTAEVLSVQRNSIDSTATTVTNNGFSIGDTISWTVSYDLASSDHFTRYLDGPDGIADRGNNDDTLFTLSCLVA